jgi:hypothetical protein
MSRNGKKSREATHLYRPEIDHLRSPHIVQVDLSVDRPGVAIATIPTSVPAAVVAITVVTIIVIAIIFRQIITTMIMVMTRIGMTTSTTTVTTATTTCMGKVLMCSKARLPILTFSKARHCQALDNVKISRDHGRDRGLFDDRRVVPYKLLGRLN